PRTVEVAGVEHGDAGLERGMDGGDRLRIVGRPVAARHAHATEPHFGNVGTVSSQSNKPHLNLLNLSNSSGAQFRTIDHRICRTPGRPHVSRGPFTSETRTPLRR